MNEKAVRGEVFRLMRRMWFWPITQTDVTRCPHGHLAYPKKGRPDIFGLNPTGRTIIVEVKILNLSKDKSFAFSNIEDEQRKWLSRWTEDGGWAYLALGTIGTKRGQRQLWLVPWVVWQLTEKIVRKHQDSIPYIAGKGFKKEMQDDKIDILHLFPLFEAEWKDSRWSLLDQHELWYITGIDRGERQI